MRKRSRHKGIGNMLQMIHCWYAKELGFDLRSKLTAFASGSLEHI